MSKARPRSERLHDIMSRMARRETFTEPVQTKMMESDYVRLQAFVLYLRSHGVPDATVSSTVRAMILEGLEGYDA